MNEQTKRECGQGADDTRSRPFGSRRERAVRTRRRGETHNLGHGRNDNGLVVVVVGTKCCCCGRTYV